jgi:Fe-S-cluster containining protein
MDYKDIENLYYLGQEDTFRFGCDCCGECCKNRGDVLLNAYDIMRLQEYLDISFQELLFTYCDLYIGNTSWLPVVRLRTEARCPFLLHKKCYVQDAKPAVCALFPLGRICDGERVRYFLQESRCGTGMEEHTLQEWLEPLGTESEKCYILWGNLLREGIMTMKQIKEENGDLVEPIQNLMVTLMYDGYDGKGDPARQIQERIDIAKELPKKVSALSATEKAKIPAAIIEGA